MSEHANFEINEEPDFETASQAIELHVRDLTPEEVAAFRLDWEAMITRLGKPEKITITGWFDDNRVDPATDSE